jgi:hypothetical protein
MEAPLKFRLTLCITLGLSFLAGSAAAQSHPPVAAKGADQTGFTYTETYEGSGNTDGFITDLNSSVGYVFNPHFAVAMGVPYFFIAPSSSQTGTTSTSGIGNPSFGLRYSTKVSALDFGTSLNTRVPIASTAKGLSTGHVTVDWSNHFAHAFDPLTPFFDVGIANSLPDTRFQHRPYISYGSLAHFEGGSQLYLGDKFSVTASGYYISPWGTQQIFLRGKKSSSVRGSTSLTKDDGINLGFDYNLTSALDLSAGYSYSAYNVVNTFSFGIEVNAKSLVKKHEER